MNRIDAHLHFVDFNQETDGFESLLRAMDAAGIEKAVLFGLPVKKKWAYHERYKPKYYLDGYSTCYYYTLTDEYLAHNLHELAKEDVSRFAPLLCGFDPTDRGCFSYLEYMFDKHPFWKGVGEVLLRHDELSLHTAGELPRVNHPCMNEVYDFCKTHQLPILIHHNAQSVGYGGDPVYVDEVREALKGHPDVQFVWAHAGVSRRTSHQDGYSEVIENLLKEYPNLAIDISWRIYEQELLDKDDRPKRDYVSLIERYADRVMIGSDLTGHFEGALEEEIHKFDNLLSELSHEAAQKVALQNAEQIYFQNGQTKK